MRITPEEAERLTGRYIATLPPARTGRAGGGRPVPSGRSGKVLARPPAKQRPDVRPEREIVREVLRYLTTRRDVTAWRCNTGMASYGDRRVRFGAPGMADSIGWKMGVAGCDYNGGVEERFPRFLAIECKSETGRLTHPQQIFLARVRAAGGVAGVVRSVQDAMVILEGGAT